MDRRTFLVAAVVGGATAASGCSGRDGFEPDVEPVERVGGAPWITLREHVEDEDAPINEPRFEEWATRRANELAVERLRAELEDDGLLGEGISVGGSTFELDELDVSPGIDRPSESEFRRAVPIGPSVFHFHHYSQEGELLAAPAVSFERLVEATPRAFEVALSFDDRDYVAVLPSLCRRGWKRNT